MADLATKTIDEIAPFAGPNSIRGIRFRPAARALGVTAWGMNVIEIDPGCERYPEHDHVKDGQEEVYVVLRGSGTLRCGGRDHPLEAGTMVRVPPSESRKIIPGPQGVTVLALGATPGRAYVPR